MDFKIGRLNLNAVAQGVGGLVFGNEHSSSSEDSYVERYLDRISNGVLAEDRRAAMSELQSLVAESQPAQLAVGAMGLPVLIGVLKEERDDVELVRGALETLVSALTPLDTSSAQKNEVQPASLNSDLLSREPDSISLLLSLLSEDDFYIRYYTLQLLTALLTNSPNRLQEAILSVPRGITRLMDMLMDREVIRNEALLLLTHVTREAEEIQKIVVFEGAFEKIFSIIKEEGGAEGGVVVQDCLELLNNLIRKVASNQILLKETIGFDPLISILKLHRGSAYNFTQQKTINLLSALGTVELLLTGGPDSDPGKDANRLSNQTVFGQRKLLDHLLMLGVESQWASISVRCSALRCIGNLVLLNPQNLNTLANKLVGEEPHVEPALSSILRIILRASTVQEFIAADHVFKCFCEKNKDGQTMLASTLSFHPHASTETNNLPFGSLLLQGLIFNETDGDLETSCRAASVLFHILMDNVQCKERIMRIGLEAPVPSLGSPEPLMHRIVKYLALATSLNYQDSDKKSTPAAGSLYVQALLLRLLIAWLFDCPGAVDCFLDAAAHLTYLVELVSNRSSSIWVRGLAAIILGECIIYNKKDGEGSRDAFSIVDTISQKIGLTSYFLNFDELQRSLISVPCAPLKHHKPLSRSIAASAAKTETVENNVTEQKPDHPILMTVFDEQFINFIKKLDREIRESIVEVFSHPKNKVVVLPAELEQKAGEDNADYIKRLKFFVQKQCNEMQDLLARNATLAEDLAKAGGGTASSGSVQKPSSGKGIVHAESLRDLQEAAQRIEILKSEKAKMEAEAVMYKNVASKIEIDLKSLSDAYSSLEQANFRLDSEVKALKRGGSEQYPDIESIRAEAREEAQKESEAELSDLLVCLGQEQSKVEKLSSRLIELGEDVDSLLEGIGDDTGLPEDGSEGEEY